ncbi:MAG TPA: competence protein ComEA [Clostridiaceae bacterium]|nr:competence protein ComEA [Clostridiaceae bacterium]
MEIKLFNRIYYINKEIIAITISFFVIISVTAGYLLLKEYRDTMVLERQEDKSLTNNEGKAGQSTQDNNSSGTESYGEEPEADEKIEDGEKIHVYVTGCVNNPGIVTLKKGQIINDAIIAAGGATNDADIENINLVYRLEGNAMLYIRSKAEIANYGEQADPEHKQEEKQTAQGKIIEPGQGEAGPGVKIIYDSGGAVVYEEKTNTDNKGKVNINTADISQLTTLPGIGEATAKDIIEYREKNGKFKTIEDIMKVPRIKEGRFNNIKDLIVVD